jgi:Inner membrane protein YgaP-like, transmembrane domain
MKKNVGSADKIVRILLAVLFAVLILTNAVSGWLAIVLGILAVVFLLTALLNFCPIWLALKISTAKKTVKV